eukprot:gnl/MRDRNA2_/MRDRNA2_27603_c0_seq1.p1 gnl/MRDRNA2_/MRDRNA2_27603_c0~~gnl/MRDRNA2_/MRDRNA2_27603_c0_seq1.p1  ORF type:complete len:593 (-),score=115.31 gnl/MRDRNA2_/MRDRNA2_27603_c0_seq1:1-1779(-)
MNRYAQLEEAFVRAQTPDVTRPPPRPWRGSSFRRPVKRASPREAERDGRFMAWSDASSPASKRLKEPLVIENDLAQLEAAQNARWASDGGSADLDDDFYFGNTRGTKEVKGRQSMQKLKSALRDRLSRLSIKKADEKRRSTYKPPDSGAAKDGHVQIDGFTSLASSDYPSRARCPTTPPRGISGDLQTLGRATLAKPKECQPEERPSSSRVTTKENPEKEKKDERRKRFTRAQTRNVENYDGEAPGSEPNRETPNMRELVKPPDLASSLGSPSEKEALSSPTSTASPKSPSKASGSRDKKIARLRKDRLASQKLREEEEHMGERGNIKRGGLMAGWIGDDKFNFTGDDRLAIASLLAPGRSFIASRNSNEGGRAEGIKHAELWNLSRELNIPLDEVKGARDIFDKFDKDESGSINAAEFQDLIRQLTATEGDLPTGVSSTGSQFFNQDADAIEFRDFVSWYSSYGFTENVVLDKGQRVIRDIARKYELPLVEVESVKRTYDGFDDDGSGEIDIEEFTKLLYKLIKVPVNLELPASRVKAFWKEIDVDGSGSVNFEEFLMWYKRYFDLTGTKNKANQGSPIEWFYKSVRPTIV